MTNESFPIAYDVAGSGPLLVAVHGITENRRYWDAVPLQEKFRTVRVDLRGHGQSPETGPYQPVTFASDIHDVVRRVGDGSAPLIVGHSYGGVVATAYASRFPVRGVVNVDQRLDVAPLPAEVAQAVRGPGFDSFMRTFFDAAYGDLDPAIRQRLDEDRVARQTVIEGIWAPLLDLSAADLSAWMADLLPAPKTPYLSLHGHPVEPDYGTWLRQRLPSAIVEKTPGVTHYPHLADPEWFVRRLLAFDPADATSR